MSKYTKKTPSEIQDNIMAKQGYTKTDDAIPRPFLSMEAYDIYFLTYRNLKESGHADIVEARAYEENGTTIIEDFVRLYYK